MAIISSRQPPGHCAAPVPRTIIERSVQADGEARLGDRHREITRVLARSKLASTQETAWANGTRPLRLNAYPE